MKTKEKKMKGKLTSMFGKEQFQKGFTKVVSTIKGNPGTAGGAAVGGASGYGSTDDHKLLGTLSGAGVGAVAGHHGAKFIMKRKRKKDYQKMYEYSRKLEALGRIGGGGPSVERAYKNLDKILKGI